MITKLKECCGTIAAVVAAIVALPLAFRDDDLKDY